MSSQLLRTSSVVTSQLRNDIPDFKVGSIVSVHYKIIEGGKQRIQVFKGIVTDRHAGNSIDATFTVTKNSFNGVKVERTFAYHSPNIDKVVVDVLQRARRASLKNLAFDRRDLSKTVRARSVKTKEVEVVKPEAVKETKPKAKKAEAETSGEE